MTLGQRNIFKERDMAKLRRTIQRKEGMVDRLLQRLADNRQTALILVGGFIVAIGAGLLLVWLL